MLRGLSRSALQIVNNMAKASVNTLKMSTLPKYETLSVTAPKEFVFHVELNRPDKLNAFNHAMWLELSQCFNHLNDNADCRVVILSGSGRLFTAGIDFRDLIKFGSEIAEHDDIARKGKILLAKIKTYQQSISSLEVCRKPVLVAVHSACIGAGINLITAADMRYCTQDAYFQVKEVDIGLAADVGVLQRLPKVIGSDTLARELCYTARKLPAPEALSCGLVSKVYPDKDSMINDVTEIAETIAKKSPVAVQVTKESLVFSRDHSVQKGLDHIALWNQTMLQSEDFVNAATGQATKQTNVLFAKL